MKKWFSLLLAAVTLTLAACATASSGRNVPSETTAPAGVPPPSRKSWSSFLTGT